MRDERAGEYARDYMELGEREAWVLERTGVMCRQREQSNGAERYNRWRQKIYEE